jgi:hypothetical protein
MRMRALRRGEVEPEIYRQVITYIPFVPRVVINPLTGKATRKNKWRERQKAVKIAEAKAKREAAAEAAHARAIADMPAVGKLMMVLGVDQRVALEVRRCSMAPVVASVENDR